MIGLRAFVAKAVGWRRLRRRRADLGEEIRMHLDLLAEEHIARGVPQAEADAAARREFGSVSVVRDLSRDVGGWRWLESMSHDVRQGLRLLTSRPGFSAAVLTTVALGVGGTAAIFSVVYGVLLRPLPYSESDRIVGLWEVHPGANAPFKSDLLSLPTYDELSRVSTTVEDVSSYRTAQSTIVDGGGLSERLVSAAATPSLFRLLRVSPEIGRFFVAADAEAGAAPVVVLADRAWRQRFGGDPSAIGRTLVVDDVAHAIVGVAPPGFELPGVDDVALYTPLVLPRAQPGKAIAILTAFARLRPGATLAQAEAESTAYARRVDRPLADLVFGRGQPVEVRVRPLSEQMTKAVRPALMVFAGGVVLFLLIACGNVASLLLARNSERSRELAIRSALGAGRRRLLRQLVTESLVISLAGGALGVFVGWASMAAVRVLAPAGFPRLDAIRMDGWFLAAAASAAMLVGILAGAPALGSSRADLGAAIQRGGLRRVGKAGHRLRHMLLVVEAALALVLLVGAALLGRSFVALVNVDAGYRPANVLTADLYAPGREDQKTSVAPLVAAILDRLRAVPQVQIAGAGSMAPFGGLLNVSGFALPGMTTTDGQPVMAHAFLAVITPGYAEALGMQLKEGRFFRAGDMASPVVAMLVNDSFARTYFADGRPVVGRRFTGMFPRMLNRTDAVTDVVGVVKDILPDRMDGQPQPQIYVPFGEGFETRYAAVVVKSDQDPASIAPQLRSIVQSVEPAATLDRVGPLAAKVSDSAKEPRFAVFVLGAFAVLALTLATTGLYGVLSYGVTERRRELGVRGALGASRGDLVAMVLREGLSLTAIGLAIGAAASALLARAMASLLFGVQPLDGVAFSAAPLLLLVTAGAACLIPAARAARVDPAEALRAE